MEIDEMTNKRCPADNERFHAMAGVAPRKRQCDFASSAPARTIVSPPLREAATTLSARRTEQNGVSS
jgi:hypothetical protein